MQKSKNELEYSKVLTTDVGKYEEQLKPIAYGLGVRHVQFFLIFISMGVLFMARSHLGVTIVGMTNHPNYAKLDNVDISKNNTSPAFLNSSKTLSKFNVSKIEHDESPVSFKKYNWSKSIQEMALVSFFIGYSIMLFPMGLVCQRWGGKIPLQIALGFNAVISVVTPWITAWEGWKAVCFCRILQGLTQAGLYPSMQTLLAKWVPTCERARTVSYTLAGPPLGTLSIFPIAGIIVTSSWGWPAVFWLIGILCFLMFGVVTVFGSASPLDHKNITSAEKNFILGNIDSDKNTELTIPWKAFLSSKHAWATFIAQAGSMAFFIFFFNQAPSYLHYVLKVDIKYSGVLSSLPYIANCICSVIFGNISDYLTNNNILTLTSARKLFNSIGLIGPALCLIATSYTSSTILGVILFICLHSLHSATNSGWMVNYLDLAPNFSGTIMATGSTLTSVCILLMPFVTSHFVTDVTNQYQWRIMFFILSGFVALTNVIFVIFMSADVQEFNDPVPASDMKSNNTEEETKLAQKGRNNRAPLYPIMTYT